MLFISTFGYIPSSAYTAGLSANSSKSKSASNGSVKVMSIENSKSGKNYKIGNYNIKSGSEVTISLIPDYGYQLNKDTFRDVPLKALDSPCEYKFIMPNRNINLSEIFIKSDDVINIESDLIENVSIDIPKNDIHGNAIFTITPIKAPKNENDFKNQASGFDILEYLILHSKKSYTKAEI